ncbi:MAG: Aldo-keto reductase YhdN [Candidatus Moanabacter tarae]|uniref:Aldo-keto reductase YhdN n=1 Tax=Candidatus Moanibacter tarae TaxID=2200854 RepID=A0A2Z4AH76_9BACT|nr:MAG: Aldo-keto reductase YhdN [Candidatus Moanabacter tarae]
MIRREFLRAVLGASGSTVLIPSFSFGGRTMTGQSDELGPLLPLRPFANTGEKLTIMGIGGWHIGDCEESESQRIIETAIENGVRFFDNAWKYHNGLSEERHGKFLTPKYRSHVFLMSKADSREGPSPRKQLEDSLRRMRTDYLDLWLIHTVSSPEDAMNRVPEMLPIIEKAIDEGKVRYAGFSGHTVTSAHLKVLEIAKGGPLKTCLMPISPVDAVSRDSFTIKVLPKLLDQGYAPLAMKTMNSGRALNTYGGKSVVPGRLSFEENFWFTLSLPICSWVSGIPNLANLRQNIDIAKRFTSLTDSDRSAIADKVTEVADASGLEPYRGWLY